MLFSQTAQALAVLSSVPCIGFQFVPNPPSSEAPGTNAKAKSGLDQSLLGVAPARMNAILLRNGARTGTRIELVPARGTSQTCNDCGYRRRENRESQARFRCRNCGHEDNAERQRRATCATAASRPSERGWTHPGKMDAILRNEPMQAGRTAGRRSHSRAFGGVTVSVFAVGRTARRSFTPAVGRFRCSTGLVARAVLIGTRPEPSARAPEER